MRGVVEAQKLGDGVTVMLLPVQFGDAGDIAIKVAVNGWQRPIEQVAEQSQDRSRVGDESDGQVIGLHHAVK